MSKAKKLTLTKKEIVFYAIAAFLATVGLVFLVFGIVGTYLPVLASDNWILVSENAWLTNWSHMGYRYWGLILIGVGAIIAIICLTYFAKAGDRDEERALRRAQRLAIASEDAPIEAESTPKEK